MEIDVVEAFRIDARCRYKNTRAREKKNPAVFDSRKADRGTRKILDPVKNVLMEDVDSSMRNLFESKRSRKFLRNTFWEKLFRGFSGEWKQNKNGKNIVWLSSN